MIGLRRNKRGDMVLTIDSYIDIDSTPDIQSDYFDCVYINTKSERAFHAILYGASPILSWKCSYKPIFVNTAVSGKEQIIDYIIDAYVSDMSNEKVYEIIDKIKMARQKFGVKSETSRPTQPNQLFANILRFLLSRDQRIMGHRLLENRLWDISTLSSSTITVWVSSISTRCSCSSTLWWSTVHCAFTASCSRSTSALSVTTLTCSIRSAVRSAEVRT